ncbi:MAG: hypothetical protein CMA63_06785 [Euryarchaeota archaeon]|nr:hypothetical protein [Euryarchaeota archaeon]|tara:strand:+ start:18394 stop:18879 length:486 start_codon:yes stop_codon:yes gene_type:complete
MSESNAEAWVYWLARINIVERTAAHWARSKRLDVDDVRQSLVVRLVECHSRFDESRSNAATWASWQCRAVATTLLRQRRRRMTETEYLDNEHPSNASQKKIEAGVEAQRVLELATKDERDAVRARVEGWTEREIRDRLNCAPFSVRRRVARLAERAEGMEQ